SLLGVTQPVLCGEQGINVIPGSQLGTRSQGCQHILFVWDLECFLQVDGTAEGSLRLRVVIEAGVEECRH
ncbi:hypothetical protein NPN18_25910, partial [Vibrio parahaemolyticus]|nr:hypothetical protein [Vibrio parahaemolyticus]